MIVVDEAYADFAGCSADELLSKYPNLIVCRTFSKWAGLAGLRAGYALGDAGFIERMLAIKQVGGSLIYTYQRTSAFRNSVQSR